MAKVEKESRVSPEGEVIEVLPVDSPSENQLVAEHLQRMPNIFSRGLVYIIILFLSVGVAYSLLGKMDVVAECRALAKPLSDKISILADITGYLEQVYIKEGQDVQSDTPLFQIRARESPQRTLEVKRLKLEQNKSTLSSIESDMSFLQSEVRRLSKEAENLEGLEKSGIVSSKEVRDAKSQMERARADLNKLISQREITQNENKILEQEMARETEESTRTIRAGSSGIVAEMYFKNTGVYIREADLLCTLVPADSPLAMDIAVLNKDIGFIEKGMPVKYKFDAFPYADYGIIRGQVAAIPPSAVDEKDRGFVYHVQGTLDRTAFGIRGKAYPLKPGMTATAEIVTENKSIFAILFLKSKTPE